MNSIELELNKHFYEKEAIEETIKVFGDWCDGTVEDDRKGKYYKISLALKNPSELGGFEREFLNHCLGRSKRFFSSHRVGF